MAGFLVYLYKAERVKREMEREGQEGRKRGGRGKGKREQALAFLQGL